MSKIEQLKQVVKEATWVLFISKKLPAEKRMKLYRRLIVAKLHLLKAETLSEEKAQIHINHLEASVASTNALLC